MEETRLPLWLILGAGVGVGTGDAGGDDGGNDGQGDDGDDGGNEGDGSEGAGEGDEGDGDEGDPDGADKLGDAGKKALDAMKAKLKAERQKRIAAEGRVHELENGGDDEDAKTRRQAESDALAKANARIVKAEVRAAAAGKLADPADALNFIDLTEFEVGEDGDVDQDDIAEAIDDLLRRKPYLAAQGGTKSPKPDRSQGAKGKGTGTAAQQFAAAIDNLL